MSGFSQVFRIRFEKYFLMTNQYRQNIAHFSCYCDLDTFFIQKTIIIFKTVLYTKMRIVLIKELML